MESLVIKIHPGVKEGTVLRVRGRGQAGPLPSDESDDLHVVVHSLPHPEFVR